MRDIRIITTFNHARYAEHNVYLRTYSTSSKTTGHFAQRATIVFACKYSIAQLYYNHYAQAGTFNVII